MPTPYLPLAQGNYPTPSRKCEFFSERMVRDGYDPLPAWLPPLSAEAEPLEEHHSSYGSNGHNGAALGSLQCISPPAHAFLNSTFVNVGRLQAREKEPFLWIHPLDAEPRGLTSGDAARVWNERGSVTLACHVTDDIMPGTVLAPGIWWSKFSPDGRNINQVTPQDEADMGAGALFYDVRVWAERMEMQNAEMGMRNERRTLAH